MISVGAWMVNDLEDQYRGERRIAITGALLDVFCCVWMYDFGLGSGRVWILAFGFIVSLARKLAADWKH